MAAQEAGVSNIIIDPGMGFYYGNLVDPLTRVRHQTKVILNSFRLRELGFPICQALPYEVAQVRAVNNAMHLLSAT